MDLDDDDEEEEKEEDERGIMGMRRMMRMR